MQVEDVISGLKQMREAREAWGKGRTEFFAAYDTLLRRYIYEGCANYMGYAQIAEALGVGHKTIRTKMREMGLDPRAGKRALNASASDAMLDNAALMGIDPKDMDLTSPLAYLPMGAEMRRSLDEQRLKASQPDIEDEEREDLLALGAILLRFIKDDEQYVSTEHRLVLDGSLWDASDEELALVKRYVSGNNA